jgi:hypothetical protein
MSARLTRSIIVGFPTFGFRASDFEFIPYPYLCVLGVLCGKNKRKTRSKMNEKHVEKPI